MNDSAVLMLDMGTAVLDSHLMILLLKVLVQRHFLMQDRQNV